MNRIDQQQAAPIALVTGFEPFDGETINPSQEIARALDREMIAGHRVVGATLPTEFARAPEMLAALMAQHRPELVLAIGLAGGRTGISLERIAINLIDARIADNAGAQPLEVAVIEHAATAYFSSLPLKAMLARLREAGIPAALSHTAGTFVCNQVFFSLAHLIANDDRGVRGGFIHLPWLPEQAARHDNAPALPLATMVDAIRLCLETALTTHADLRVAGGSKH